MNILLVGSGAREHAIAKALSRSQTKACLFCCGSSNNPGIMQLTTGYWSGDINQTDTVLKLAQDWGIHIVIIGPEAPLEQGLADLLWDSGIPVIGPKKRLAQIETSKAFTRELMHKYQIPGLPKYKIFKQIAGVSVFLEELGEGNYVVKMNGLMAGKGVKVAGDHLHSIAEALAYCEDIIKLEQTVVIEEKLIGQEFSFMCFTDGKTLVPMPLVQDNKRAFAGDKGPNTGGMGSFSAADHGLPFLLDSEVSAAYKINQQVLQALTNEVNDRYVGILYGSFIATAQGVYVIEFNARFGDPESLNILSILESDFVALVKSMVDGKLNPDLVRFARKATVCKYAVPQGYPDEPLRNVPIDINAVQDKQFLFLAAVNEDHGALYATGSRTAAFVGVADSISAAEAIAEEEISQVKGPLFHRQDIGTSELLNQRIQAMQALRAI